MKVFKYLILCSVIFNGTINKLVANDFPADIWFEIIQNNFINKDKHNEEEIFKNMDNLRLTSKNAKLGVDKLVQKTAKELNKDPMKYTYSEFKADIMDKIIDDNVKERYKTSTVSNYRKIESGLERNAKNWLGRYLKNRTPELQKVIDEILLNQAVYNATNYDAIDKVKLLLKLGANPNFSIDYGASQAREPIILLKLISKILSQLAPDVNKAPVKDYIEMIKILLELGADPNLKDKQTGGSPFSFSKREFSEISKHPNSKFDPNLTLYALGTVIELFEDAIKKQEDKVKQEKKSRKEKYPFIGIM